MSIRDRIRKVKHLQNKYFICVLENPGKIVNIASTIRNISAFGVDKLYIVGSAIGGGGFETTRSSKTLKRLSVGANKWVYVKSFKNAEECIDYLKRHKYIIAVTSSHQIGKKNMRLYDETFTQKRLAIWFGSEACGVSDYAVNNAEICIQIPMGGVVESLNLGTSTGIILSYISYQRQRYIFDNKKVRGKSKKWIAENTKSWEEFFV